LPVGLEIEPADERVIEQHRCKRRCGPHDVKSSVPTKPTNAAKSARRHLGSASLKAKWFVSRTF
jgi:hypothetical protein